MTMWLIIVGIGVLSIVGLGIYDRAGRQGQEGLRPGAGYFFLVRRSVVAGQVLVVVAGHLGMGRRRAERQRPHFLRAAQGNGLALLDLGLLAAHRADIYDFAHRTLLLSHVPPILSPRRPLISWLVEHGGSAAAFRRRFAAIPAAVSVDDVRGFL
ncbi:MAG: hypothetical protein M0C28_20085 [Candidatus Moduliflexus flocculans]|nr:hypothetical protein [Candidatus Moduliflexus flocculans]